MAKKACGGVDRTTSMDTILRRRVVQQRGNTRFEKIP